MEEKYREIKLAYDNLYNERLKKGLLPLKNTEIGYWAISTADDLFDLFQKLNLKQYKRFIDLGSGDGKAVLIASLFTQAHGIEYDEELYQIGKDMASRYATTANLIKGDFLKTNLSNYDFIFINPDKRLHELERKLKLEAKGRLVIYGNEFSETSFPKETQIIAKTTPATIYKVN